MLAAVSSVAASSVAAAQTTPISGGGRFDFDDGGTYCGDWEDGKAHGHGVCTGPKGQGEYAGQWAYGFEVQGVYTWPSGNNYEGQWMGGKRHGLGVEAKGRWIYRGEWTHGFKGRYGVRISDSSGAKYEGTWANGLQDGYGIEFYADGGTFQGQWLRGVRHGYGVRTSAPYGVASHYRQAKALRSSLTSLRSEADEGSVLRADSTGENDTRGGFVLRTNSDEPPLARRGSIFARGNSKSGAKKIGGGLFAGLKLRKQQSTGDLPQQRRPGKAGSLNSSSSIQSYVSDGSSIQSVGAMTDVDQYDGDSNLSYVSTEEILEANVTEIYMGEWKNDKRAGFGVCDRSDGLKYEGEWFNNKKSGYGITTFKDGTKEEGKYKNNVLVTSSKQRKLLVRSAKLRERIDSSLQAAIRASQLALGKADIAISRTAMARGKAESADQTAGTTREDMAKARVQAKLYAPSFYQPGPDVTKKSLIQMGNVAPGASLTASKLLYTPALRNTPSPVPPAKLSTNVKEPPQSVVPAQPTPPPVDVAPSPAPSEQDHLETTEPETPATVELTDMLENDLAVSLASEFMSSPEVVDNISEVDQVDATPAAESSLPPPVATSLKVSSTPPMPSPTIPTTKEVPSLPPLPEDPTMPTTGDASTALEEASSTPLSPAVSPALITADTSPLPAVLETSAEPFTQPMEETPPDLSLAEAASDPPVVEISAPTQTETPPLLKAEIPPEAETFSALPEAGLLPALPKAEASPEPPATEALSPPKAFAEETACAEPPEAAPTHPVEPESDAAPFPNRVPTPAVPEITAPPLISPVAASSVAAPPAPSPRTPSPVAPTASPPPPVVAESPIPVVADAAAILESAPPSAAVIIKPFTQLHVSSSSVPSPEAAPSPPPPSSISPTQQQQHLAAPDSGVVEYPENFSGSRRGSSKPVLQRMEGFDADLSGAKFAKVALQADRFSQYGAKREDSGIGSEIGAPLSVSPGVSAGDLGASAAAAAAAEELLAQQLEQISLPTLQRRKSLPSLVKRDITGSLKYPEEAAETAAADQQPETILIEDGTKKRLVATDEPGPPPAPYAAPSLPNPRTPVVLPKAVVAETIAPKLTKSELNRSFTDLASANKGTEGISRVEASQLGSQRREEIRRAKELEASQTEFDRFRAQMKSASGEATPDDDRMSVGSQGSRASRASRLSAIHGGIVDLQANNQVEEELVSQLQAQIQEQAEIDELMHDYMRERKRQIRISRRKRELQEQLALIKQQDDNDIERRINVAPAELTPDYLESATTEELQEIYVLQQREHRRRQLIRRIGHLDRKMKGGEEKRQKSEQRRKQHKDRHERARRISDDEEEENPPADRDSLRSGYLPAPLGGGGAAAAAEGGEEGEQRRVAEATKDPADQMARIRRGY